jgi:concanavalin A-like lectin/glucanase superfamily protein/DnaJ-like protein
MDDLPKYYQLLGLEPGASPEEAKQAYRDMVKVWHPDRFAHDERLRAMAQDKLKEINGAYEILKSRAFQESIGPEPTAASETESTAANPSPARNRTTLWTTLGVLLLVLVAAAAFLFYGKGRGKTTAFSPQAAPAIAASSLSSTNAQYALSFNGNHSQLAIATTGSLTGTFTLEFWALTHKAAEGGTILRSGTAENFGFNIRFRPQKWIHTDLSDGSAWLAKGANARFRYKIDTWYHIAYVATPTNYSVYINGTELGSGTINPPGNPMLYDVTHQLSFGGLDGSLAEIRIWKTARTQAQIESNMNQTLTGNEPGLMGYWRFAEGSETTAADSSGHGFDGTLMGNDVLWSKEIPPVMLH